MKRTLLLLLFAIPFLVIAQFSENFDSGTMLPAGWKVINGGDSNGFLITEGAPGTALSQPNAAQINFSSTAHDDYLITTPITVTAGVSDRLLYFAKSQDAEYLENYEVKLSTTTATADAFTTVLTPSAGAPSEWTPFSINLTPYIGQTIYIAFHATSADKFRLLFDDVRNDTPPTITAGCPITLSKPENNATEVDFSNAIFDWSASSSGGKVDYYELYLGTNPNAVTKIGVYTNPTALLTNLLSNTTYYWKVIAKNAAGESVGCLVNTFKTKIDPILPYCGPLTYSNGVEPITSVEFGGMINASSDEFTSLPHEVFTDKIATVKQGSSFDIKLQGNTDGDYTSRFMVFIDWNQDGDFLDEGETYFNSGNPLIITNSTGVDGKVALGSISIPENALLGNTRMRIKKNFSTVAYSNPCFSSGTLALGSTAGYGQAEDYTVNVLPKTLATSSTNKSQLAVYPNPMREVLKINSADKKVNEVTFYSMDGKLVKKEKENLSNINVENLPKGVYIVKVKTSDSEKSFKVIKE